MKTTKQFLLYYSVLLLQCLMPAMEHTKPFLMPATPFIIDGTPAFCECANQYYITARVKGKEVGRVHYSYILDSYITFMHRLSVNPEFRKRGIATALVKACISHSLKNHKKFLVWEAMPLDNNLSLNELVGVYKKIVHTIDPKLQLTVSEPYGTSDSKKVNMRIQLGKSS